jgi:hypothetical protein
VIDLSCSCGRTYQVPPTKAGRKLQCKRCGAVTRIPHPDSDDVFVVPFQVTEEAAEQPLDLAVAEETHRCPSCGTTDDMSVVICVRCGYDWRTGNRIEESAQLGLDVDEALADEAAVASALQVIRWGLVCLSPLGVALGPVTLLKSMTAENALRRDAPELQGLAVARLQAAGGFVIWTALILAFAWWAQGREEVVQQHLAIQCAARLEHLGSRIKRELESEATFPEQPGDLRDALAALAERDPDLNSEHLRCPLAEDLYPFKTRDEEELTQGVDAGYLLIWDSEPHADVKGQTSYRALRFDGKVESFEDRETLREGLAREPFGELAAPSAGPKPTASRAGQGPPQVQPEARLRRFVALADECDRRDPWLEKELVVEALIFTERAGIPPQDLLPIALASTDVTIRRYGARMLARSQLGPEKVGAMAREVAKDRDLDVRFGAARALQRVGQSFLDPLVLVLEQGSSELKAATVRMIGREASAGRAEAERVLRLMNTVRTQAQAGGDDAMFPLPQQALQHVAPFLGDADLGVEARAVFLNARKEAVEPLRTILRQGAGPARKGAFVVAQAMVEAEILDLAGYLEFVDAERDVMVQAKALEPFQAKADRLAPNQVLTRWLLDFAREKDPQGPLLLSIRQLLARVGRPPLPDDEPGSVEQLVAALTEDGEHTVILDELGAEERLQNLEIDEWIADRWKKIPTLASRRKLVEILSARPYESAQRTLLVALSDREPDVRALAAQQLIFSRALRSDRFRRDAARLLGKLLRKEEDPLVRQRLLEFAQGKHVCGRYPADDRPAKHSCSEPILSFLRAQAKKGDRSALRCLTTHPSLQAVKSLIEVLKATTRDRELRSDIMSELKNLTGLSATSSDAGSWDREITKRSEQLEKRLRAAAEREREAIRRNNERAEAKAQKIIKKAGPKRRGL